MRFEDQRQIVVVERKVKADDMDFSTRPRGRQLNAGNQLQAKVCRMLLQKMVGSDRVVIGDGQGMDVALLRSQAELKRVERTIGGSGVAV